MHIDYLNTESQTQPNITVTCHVMLLGQPHAYVG